MSPFQGEGWGFKSLPPLQKTSIQQYLIINRLVYIEFTTPPRCVYLSESSIPQAGRGVFASRTIKPNELIESCPIVLIPALQVQHLRYTELFNYYFSWGDKREQAAIALGYGSLYNHSYDPNATYVKQVPGMSIDFIALKPILRGTEILVNYNAGNPRDSRPLWIKNIKPPKK